MTEKAACICIDWYNTASSDKYFQHLFDSDKQADLQLASTLQNTLFGDMASYINPWMRGQYTSEEIMTTLASRSHLPYEIVMDEFVTSCRSMLFTFPELPFYVQQLRDRGYKVAIATDNMDSFYRWTSPALGLPQLFDHILISHRLHALKGDFHLSGDSLFFGEFLAKNHLSPHQITLFDDSPDPGDRLTAYGIKYRRISSPTDFRRQLSHLLG